MSAGLELLNSDAVHIREQSKIDAARIVQKSNNELKGAMAAAAAYGQSYSNQRKMKAAGDNIAAIAENTARNLDAATTGRFVDRLAAAEAVGANVAAASAAGVGGSSVEMFAATQSVNQALQEEQQDRALRSDLMNSSAAIGDTLEAGAASLDNQTYQAGLDYTQYVDHVKVSGVQKVLGFAAAAAATYYGGPQAGEAVLSVVSAQNRAANGDFDGAAQRAGQAFTGAVGAAKGYSDRGATPWATDVWASVKKRGAGANYKI